MAFHIQNITLSETIPLWRHGDMMSYHTMRWLVDLLHIM